MKTFDSISEHANQRIRDNDKKLGHFTFVKKKKVCTKKNMLEELADFHAYGFHSIGINYKTKVSIQLIREALHYAKKAYNKINLLNK